MEVGESKQFNYNGGIQEYIIETDGLYQLDVYGAKGGNGTNGGKSGQGGYGGHAKTFAELKAGQKIFIVCGGAGTTNNSGYGTTFAGGYNGGGQSQNGGLNSYINYQWCGSGGGATHIASITGTLQSIGASNKDKLYVVAGGGGGGFVDGASGNARYGGGYGGGTNGGTSDAISGRTGGGGTQTSAGTSGGFGYGGAYYSSSGTGSSGGGGGLYGGGRGNASAGGGGSGYIPYPSIEFNGQTYNSVNENGKCSGNGYSIITFIATSGKNIFLGNHQVLKAFKGNSEVELYLGNIKL